MTELTVLTTIHTALSVFALLLGIGMVSRFAAGRRAASWEPAFLWLAVLTTLTGFLFPFHGITPAIAVGAVSSVVLIVALIARAKAGAFARGWLATFVVTAIVAEYLLCFVAVAQAFTKVAVLHALAPTLKEAPFGLTQAVVLVVFLVITVRALRRFTAASRVTAEKSPLG